MQSVGESGEDSVSMGTSFSTPPRGSGDTGLDSMCSRGGGIGEGHMLEWYWGEPGGENWHEVVQTAALFGRASVSWWMWS